MMTELSQTHEAELFNELQTIRRKFHQYPEIGGHEFWTTARICEYLDALDCTLLYGDQLYRDFPAPELLTLWPDELPKADNGDEWIGKLHGRTGAIAIIQGKQEGPTFGFRVDIDGLPIKESHDPSHRPYAEGFQAMNDNMHACGHDGHITIGLGLAKTLASHTEELKGRYYLFFQPAEETIAGGRIFARLPYVKELDYFFPLHVGLLGTRQIVCGLSFLADKRYSVSFRGRSSHAGGSPEQGKNALLAACHAVTGLYGISRHSGGRSRVNVGEFSAPNASNVIPDATQFELDLRGETNEICDYLKDQAEHIIEGAALMHQVEFDMQFLVDAEMAENSPELLAAVRQAGLDIGIQSDAIVERHLVSGSEDATFIMNEVIRHGGLTTYIGLSSPTYGGHHHKQFDFDETILPEGVKLLCQLIHNLTHDM
ncbi:peptidase [candidate division KSB3 bacterium]|uniref:Peptidase n=1 Tax=candidate division KSB3 bacterium TaxID=2044937 RepID=A0A2G6KFW5_9BACT|nr:MAG: peptidase [candidate division KSB3 bacterium]